MNTEKNNLCQFLIGQVQQITNLITYLTITCQFLIGQVQPGRKEQHVQFNDVSIPYRPGTTADFTSFLFAYYSFFHS